MSRITRELAWTVVSRGVAAALQAALVLLLGIQLDPSRFGIIIAVNSVLYAIVALNGFGIIRQLQVRRSLDARDPALGAQFTQYLSFIYASGVIWLALCITAGLVLHVIWVLWLGVLSLWLIEEQVTAVWNAVSVIDRRNHLLLPSYVARRLPVVAFLAVSSVLEWDATYAWIVGMSFGSILAVGVGWPSAESWSRLRWPTVRRRNRRMAASLDFAFWWGLVGPQLRNIDVVSANIVDRFSGGVYSFGARVISPLNLVTSAICLVLFPRVVRMRRISGRYLWSAVGFGCIPVVLLSALVYAIAPMAVALVGHAYGDATDVIRVLCFAAVFWGASSLLTAVLQSREDRVSVRRAGIANFCAGMAQLGAVPTGVAYFGAIGGAYAATCCHLCLVLVLALSAQRVVMTRE